MTAQPPSRDQAESTSRIGDPVGDILLRALAGPEEDWDVEVARACEQHPEQAESLRRRFARLNALGLARKGSFSSSAAAPERLGDFRLLELLGSGGMGVVYLAEQESLHRKVALKLIKGAGLHAPHVHERFRREIEAASKLDHPGICTVYEAGEIEGTPYIAMRYVEGESLAQRIARAKQSASSSGDSSPTGETARKELDKTLSFFEQAARALHAAHDAGLVHRDIKPANVMVTAEGSPVILDFGLARIEDSEQGTLTMSSALLGTPAYMAPEQVSGAADAVGRRADVYALGVSLYEALTLHRPFEAPTRESLFHQILTSAPPNPRRFNRRVSGELKVVLDTALEKQPARRYQTALDLAEDLRRLQAREPTRARPASAGLRLRRWVQRNPIGATLVAVLAAGLLATLLLLGQVSSERTDKARALVRARANALANASGNELRGDPMLALLLAREAMRLDGSHESRSRVVAALAELHEERVFRHPGIVASAAWSPAGDRILTSSAAPRVAYLWSKDGELQREMGPHASNLVLALFSPDGGRIVTCPFSGRAFLWDGEGRRVARLPPLGGVDWGLTGYVSSKAAAFSPTGELFCVGYRSGEVWLFDRAGEPVASLLDEHEGGVLCVAFSPDGTHVASGGRDGRVAVQDRTGRVLWRHEHGGAVTSVSFSPDGATLLTSSEDATALLWELEPSSKLELRGHFGPLHEAVFSPDGTLVATASRDRTVRLWELTGRELWRTSDHDYDSGVTGVCFSPDGQLLLGRSNNGVALVHDLEGRRVANLRGHGNTVTSAAFSPAGDEVLTASIDNTARLWSLSVPDFPVLRGHRLAVTAAAISPDGGGFVTGSMGGDCRVMDNAGGLRAAFDAGSGVRSISWSPRGDRILSGHMDGTATLWDLDGEERTRFRACEKDVNGTAFFPDGGRILTDGGDGVMRVWTCAEDKVEELREFEGHGTDNALGVVLFPDGERILSFLWNRVTLLSVEGETLAIFPVQDATGGALSPSGDRALIGLSKGDLVLLDTSSQKLVELDRFEGHRRGVYAIDYSPNGELVVTGSRDGTVRLWKADGTPLVRMRHGDGSVWSVAFSPDGERVLSTSSKGTTRWWPVVLEELSELAASRTVRGFLPEEVAKYAELLGPGLVANAPEPVTSQELNLASWEVVRDPRASPGDYAEALRRAEKACSLRLDDAASLNTLGVARYRAGLFREAVATLSRSDALNQASRQPYSRDIDLAFLAMSRHRLGELEEARALLQELRELTAEETDAEVLGFLAEAQELIEGVSPPR